MNSFNRNEKQTVIDVFNRRADERIERKHNEKQLEDDIKQKNSQISILNHVNTRLGAELAILQKKLGIDHGKIIRELENIQEISAAFHFETEQLQYLDALLTAYDENILKQKKIIAHLYNSLQDSQKKSKNLVQDNEFLLHQLQNKTKQILQIYQKGFVDDNLTSAYNKLQRETQIQMIQNIRKQNEYLLHHYETMVVKVEELQFQLKEAKDKSEYYFQLYRNQSEDMKQALVKIDDLLKIKDVLERKFDDTTQENIELETIKQQLETKINRIENNNKELRNQLHMQRTVKAEELERINQDFSSLKLDHDASQKRQREYFNKNMMLEKELQNQREDVKLLKRELEKTKSDFEQTLKMCEAYQSKITNYSKKETIMRQQIESNKQRLQNALLEKDKAMLKEKQLQKLLQSIKQRNRDEIEALKNTFEKLMSEQNERIRILEEEKQDSNSIYYQNQCSLKHQIEKLKRDNQAMKEQNKRYSESIKINSGHQIVGRLKQLQQKNETLSRMITQKDRAFKQDLQHKDEVIITLQNDNRDLGKQIDKQRASAREAINQRTQLKSKISMLQKQKQCLQEQISKLKKVIDSRSALFNQQKQEKIRQLQQKLQDAILREKKTKQNTIELLQKHDEAQEQYQVQCQNKIMTLEAEVRKLRKKIEKEKMLK